MRSVTLELNVFCAQRTFWIMGWGDGRGNVTGCVSCGRLVGLWSAPAAPEDECESVIITPRLHTTPLGSDSVMARQKVILTYEDYQKLPDNGTRKEILGGELFVTPAPTPRHQHAVGTMYAALKTHIDARRLGEVLTSPIDVVLSPTDVVQPDIVFIAERRRDIIGEAAIHGAPDLVVEVLSPGTAAIDRGRKMQAYARATVPEYWIVDLDVRAVEVYHLEGGKYRLAARAERGAWTPELFPGLVITLDTLWGG